MQPFQYIMYFNEEVVSPGTHKVINKETVNLSKSVFILD